MAQGAALSPPSPGLAPVGVFPGILTGRDGEGGRGGLGGPPALHVVGRHSDVVRRALQGEQHTQHVPASPALAGEGRRIAPSPLLQCTMRRTQLGPHSSYHWQGGFPQPTAPAHHEEHSTGIPQPKSLALTSPPVQSPCYETLGNPCGPAGWV